MKKILMLATMILPFLGHAEETNQAMQDADFRKEFKLRKKVEYLLRKQMEPSRNDKIVRFNQESRPERSAAHGESEVRNLGTPSKFCHQVNENGHCAKAGMYWKSDVEGRVYVFDESTDKIVIYQRQ